MMFGKLSMMSGFVQVICVGSMFLFDTNSFVEMGLTMLSGILILFSMIMSSISFFKRERPLICAIIGIGISTWWLLWGLLLPMLRAF